MDLKGNVLRPNETIGSGRVREYQLGRKRRMFQITTFCPKVIGPGPTHLYLIEDDALILVDTGIPTDLAKNIFYYWRNQRIPAEIEALPNDYSFQEFLGALKLTGHDIKDIDYIVITHGHPDHYLMGRKLVELSGARVAAHVSDSDKICNPWGLVKMWVERREALMAIGMPPPRQWGGQAGGSGQTRAVMSPETTDLSLRIDCPVAFDGRLKLDDFEKDTICVRHFAGHSAGGIAILVYDDDGQRALMLCGDTLLYPITPHPDDLVAYLRTLKYMRGLNDVELVLPAHGKAITNLSHRLDFLEEHHERRLRMTYEACKRPKSIWEIATMRRYFDVYVDPNRFNPLAGQEAFVHVELLQMAGGLHCSHVNGIVHYFQNSGERFEDVYKRAQALVNDENTTMLMRR
jgi:glyoxylase-like metal-dependent hydrolase (beta-lactamase superfamily II)